MLGFILPSAIRSHHFLSPAAVSFSVLISLNSVVCPYVDSKPAGRLPSHNDRSLYCELQT